MIAVVSPAKTLDFDTPSITSEKSIARLFDRSKPILEVLKSKTPEDLMQLMDISEDLAMLNAKRYKNFKTRHTDQNSKQAMFAFKGDVYLGLDANSFDTSEIEYAQQHFRMLSGLYGVLRPLDMIQPYRLEMGTSLMVEECKNLYQYWGDVIGKTLNQDLTKQGDKILVNLASIEYFKAVDKKKIKGKIIDVEFKDFKNGDYKIISFFAKKARGMMARYMIKNRISTINDLKGFDYDGYYFDAQNSTETELAFKRG
jgi:uncharacterized protein